MTLDQRTFLIKDHTQAILWMLFELWFELLLHVKMVYKMIIAVFQSTLLHIFYHLLYFIRAELQVLKYFLLIQSAHLQCLLLIKFSLEIKVNFYLKLWTMAQKSNLCKLNFLSSINPVTFIAKVLLCFLMIFSFKALKNIFVKELILQKIHLIV